MKRKLKFEHDSKNIANTKKVRVLSDAQIKIASIIVDRLEENKIEAAEFLLKFSFAEDKEIENLLICTNYKPIKWAIDHLKFDLIKYLIEHNTPRGQFLALCQNNYENIKNFVNVFLEQKFATKAEKKSFMDVLELFIDVKPNQIAPIVLDITEQKMSMVSNLTTDDQKAELLMIDTIESNITERKLTLSNIEDEDYSSEILGITKYVVDSIT